MNLDTQGNVLLQQPPTQAIPEDLLRWLRDGEQYLARFGDQRDKAERLLNQLRDLAEAVNKPQAAFAEKKSFASIRGADMWAQLREQAKTVRGEARPAGKSLRERLPLG